MDYNQVEANVYLPYLIELINRIAHSRKQSNSRYHLHKDAPSAPEQQQIKHRNKFIRFIKYKNY